MSHAVLHSVGSVELAYQALSGSTLNLGPRLSHLLRRCPAIDNWVACTHAESDIGVMSVG